MRLQGMTGRIMAMKKVAHFERPCEEYHSPRGAVAGKRLAMPRSVAGHSRLEGNWGYLPF